MTNNIFLFPNNTTHILEKYTPAGNEEKRKNQLIEELTTSFLNTKPTLSFHNGSGIKSFLFTFDAKNEPRAEVFYENRDIILIDLHSAEDKEKIRELLRKDDSQPVSKGFGTQTTELKDINTQTDETFNSSDTLKLQIDQLQKNLNKSIEKTNDLNILINHLQEENKSATAELDALKTANQSQIQKIHSLHTEIESLKHNLKDKESEVNQISEKYHSLLSDQSILLNQLAILSTENSTFENSNESLKQVIDKLKTRNKILIDENLKSKNKIKELENEKNAILINKELLEEISKEQNRTIQSLETHISNINNELTTKNTEIDLLKKQISDLETKITENNTDNKNKQTQLHKEIQSLKDKEKSILSEIQKLKQQRDLYKNNVRKAQEKIRYLESELANQKKIAKRIPGLKLEITKLKSELEQLNSQNQKNSDQNKGKIKQIANQLKAKTAELQNAKDQLNSVKNSLKKANEEISSLKNINQTQQSELESLQEDLVFQSSREMFLQEELEKATQDKTDLELQRKKEKSQLESTISDLQERLNFLTRDGNELTKHTASLEKKLSQFNTLVNAIYSLLSDFNISVPLSEELTENPDPSTICNNLQNHLENLKKSLNQYKTEQFNENVKLLANEVCLQDTVKSLEDQITGLKNQITNLQKMIPTQEQITSLQAQEAELNNLRIEVSIKQKYINQLRENLREGIHTARARVYQELEGKINTLKERVALKEQRIAKLQEQNNQLNATNTDQSATLSKNYKEIEKLKTEITTSQAAIETLTSENSDLQQYIYELLVFIGADSEKYENLTKEHNNALKECNNAFQRINETLKTQGIETLGDAVSAAINRIIELENEQQDLYSQLDTAKREIFELNKYIEKFKEKATEFFYNLQEEISNLEMANEDLLSHFQENDLQHKNTIQRLEKTISSREYQIGQIQSALADLKSEKSNLEHQIQENSQNHETALQTLKKEHEEEISSITTQNNTKTNQLKDDYEKKLSTLNKTFEQRKTEIENSHQAKNNELEAKNKEISSQLRTINTKLETLQKEKDSLNNELTTARSENNTLREQNGRLIANEVKLKEKISRTERENQELTSRLTFLHGNFEAITKNQKERESELEKARNDLANLNSELSKVQSKFTQSEQLRQSAEKTQKATEARFKAQQEQLDQANTQLTEAKNLLRSQGEIMQNQNSEKTNLQLELKEIKERLAKLEKINNENETHKEQIVTLKTYIHELEAQINNSQIITPIYTKEIKDQIRSAIKSPHRMPNIYDSETTKALNLSNDLSKIKNLKIVGNDNDIEIEFESIPSFLSNQSVKQNKISLSEIERGEETNLFINCLEEVKTNLLKYQSPQKRREFLFTINGNNSQRMKLITTFTTKLENEINQDTELANIKEKLKSIPYSPSLNEEYLYRLQVLVANSFLKLLKSEGEFQSPTKPVAGENVRNPTIYKDLLILDYLYKNSEETDDALIQSTKSVSEFLIPTLQELFKLISMTSKNTIESTEETKESTPPRTQTAKGTQKKIRAS